MVTSPYFWLSVGLCFVGYFVFRFGMLDNSSETKTEVEFVGGALLTGSFILAAFFVGWEAFLILVLLFWFVVTPVTEISLKSLSGKSHKANDGNKRRARAGFIMEAMGAKQESDRVAKKNELQRLFIEALEEEKELTEAEKEDRI